MSKSQFVSSRLRFSAFSCGTGHVHARLCGCLVRKRRKSVVTLAEGGSFLPRGSSPYFSTATAATSPSCVSFKAVYVIDTSVVTTRSTRWKYVAGTVSFFKDPREKGSGMRFRIVCSVLEFGWCFSFPLALGFLFYGLRLLVLDKLYICAWALNLLRYFSFAPFPDSPLSAVGWDAFFVPGKSHTSNLV